MLFLSSLFEDEPQQWGLRGDPYLWRDMQKQFEDVPLPNSPEELESLIRSTFQSLTGCALDANKFIKLDKYNHGGMSGGGISTDFWLESALPLLLSRLRAVVD